MSVVPAALPRAALLAAVAALLAACPAEDELVCIEVEPTCAPLYEPTYTNVFTMTLEPKCSVSNACHAGPAPRAGLDLSDPDAAYDGLTGGADPLVVPGDGSCSVMVQRVGSTASSLQMPPGNDGRLSDAEVCALQRWIEDGALRDDLPAARSTLPTP